MQVAGDQWSCSVCTFLNDNHKTKCEMCNGPSPSALLSTLFSPASSVSPSPSLSSSSSSSTFYSPSSAPAFTPSTATALSSSPFPPPLPPAASAPYFPSFPVPSSRRTDRSEIRAPPSSECLRRLVLDLKEVQKSKDPTIHVCPDENDVTRVQALIIGVEGTPYHGGFFLFDMQFPSDYPWKPPRVTLLTTDNNTVRFNPNLYACGKVCLSILGTWAGPSWTSIQTMLSTLMSIQSLMNEKPYHNEPGHEVETRAGDVQNYNDCIAHETLRVAVIGMLEDPSIHKKFKGIMGRKFLAEFDSYLAKAEQGRALDGKQMQDPFGEERGYFRYGSLIPRLHALKKRIEDQTNNEKEEEASSESSSEEEFSDDEDDDEDDSKGKEKDDEQKDGKKNESTNDLSSIQQPETTIETKVTEGDETKNEDQKNKEDTTEPSSSPSLPPLIESERLNNATDDASEKELTSPSMPALVEPEHLPTFAFEFKEAKESREKKGEEEEMDPDLLLALKLSAELNNTLPTPQLSTPFELDAALAMSLQAEWNAAPQHYSTSSTFGGGNKWSAHHHHHHSSLSSQPRSGTSSTTTATTPSTKSLKELKKEAKQHKKSKDYDPSVVCLICKQSPKEYIIPPGCEQPHIYCFACAERIKTQASSTRGRFGNRGFGDRSSSAPVLRCVLCKSVSHLDSNGGVEALKRRRKRKRTSPGVCPEHNEPFNFFCMDEAVLICHLCVGGEHSRHRCEALEEAYNALTDKVEDSLKVLEGKWTSMEGFVQQMEEKQNKLEEAVAERKKEVKDLFDQLRAMLDEKEKEVEAAMNRVEEQKRRQIQGAKEKAQQQMESIPASISALSAALEKRKKCHHSSEMSSSSSSSSSTTTTTTTSTEKPPSKTEAEDENESPALSFLRQYEDKEETVRHLCNMVMPKLNDSVSQMPNPIYLRGISHVIKRAQYIDSPEGYIPTPPQQGGVGGGYPAFSGGMAGAYFEGDEDDYDDEGSDGYEDEYGGGWGNTTPY